MLAKNTLALSKQGYELLDKKRNVLIKEIMELNEKAVDIQANIEKVFAQAYAALQTANIEMGISQVEQLCHGIPKENSISIKMRSVMGVEIPVINYNNTTKDEPFFGFGDVTTAIDEAARSFNEVKDLIIQLAAVENAAYRLAINIKKTQKRANALKNIIIPRYEDLTKEILETLEERERDEFTRLKVVKKKYNS